MGCFYVKTFLFESLGNCKQTKHQTFEKNSQIGSFPQVGVKVKHILSCHHLEKILPLETLETPSGKSRMARHLVGPYFCHSFETTVAYAPSRSPALAGGVRLLVRYFSTNKNCQLLGQQIILPTYRGQKYISPPIYRVFGPHLVASCLSFLHFSPWTERNLTGHLCGISDLRNCAFWHAKSAMNGIWMDTNPCKSLQNEHM